MSVISGIAVMVDAEDVPLVSDRRWHADSNGYIVSTAAYGRTSMHRLVMGLQRGDPREVDHAYHLKYDNRKSQLRLAAPWQNKANTRKAQGTTSRFKGVSWDRGRSKWVAQIRRGDVYRIARFAAEVDAARAYDRWASEIFGEFAVLNFGEGRRAFNFN